jgi:hypothetical protein
MKRREAFFSNHNENEKREKKAASHSLTVCVAKKKFSTNTFFSPLYMGVLCVARRARHAGGLVKRCLVCRALRIYV